MFISSGFLGTAIDNWGTIGRYKLQVGITAIKISLWINQIINNNWANLICVLGVKQSAHIPENNKKNKISMTF